MNFINYCQNLSYSFTHKKVNFSVLIEKWTNEAPILRVIKIDEKDVSRYIYAINITDEDYKEIRNNETKAIKYILEAIENDKQ